MPLYINSSRVPKAPSPVSKFVEKFPHFQESAAALTATDSQIIEGEKLIYVCQREYAVAEPSDEQIDFIGSEDATTCHLLVIRHSGSGVTALAHCDGSGTNDIVSSLVKDVTEVSRGGPEGRLEAHVVGGFLDDRAESINLTYELIDSFIACSEDVHLITACFTDLNDTLKNEVHFPVIYGIAVEVKTGRIIPATFPDKGPDMDIRGALCFAGYKKVHNIYDHQCKELVIGPYDWEAVYNIDVYVNLPDAYIRKYLSTSPKQEPAHFENHVRTSLKLLREHPDPSVSLFPDGLAKRYKKGPHGEWIRVSNKNHEHDKTKHKSQNDLSTEDQKESLTDQSIVEKDQSSVETEIEESGSISDNYGAGDHIANQSITQQSSQNVKTKEFTE